LPRDAGPGSLCDVDAPGLPTANSHKTLGRGGLGWVLSPGMQASEGVWCGLWRETAGATPGIRPIEARA
jgi:hypothetical protein